MTTRPCVSKTQKRASRAHTRPRTRVDVKLSHKLYEFVRFLIKLWPVLDVIFRMLHVGSMEEVPRGSYS